MSYKLFSTVSGSGPTIVFLHGFLNSSHYYSRIRKRIEKNHTVVALDLLGHGKSPKPNDIEYTFQDHIDAIHYTLTSLGIKPPFVLAGHSMGALLSLRYTREYETEISRLMLFNPPMFANSEEAYLQVFRTALHYRLFLFSNFKDHLWKMVQIIPRNPLSIRHPLSLTDMLRAGATARVGSLHNVIFKGDIFSEVRDISTPTMLVMGQKDRYNYLQNALQTKWPDHVTIRLNKFGHHGIALKPKLGETYINEHIVYNK